MLALLGLPYKTIDVDLVAGEHKSQAFLQKNTLGQVPVIDDNGLVLADSNAILVYLATQYGDAGAWTGNDAVEKAHIQRWLSIAAGEIVAGPCSARLVTVFNAPLDHEQAKSTAHALLEVMNATLENNDYLVLQRLTLADIAAYSYIAHAPEGGVGLTTYPNVEKWLKTIEATAGFVGMETSPRLA
jgi:glutathione S-transferase